MQPKFYRAKLMQIRSDTQYKSINDFNNEFRRIISSIGHSEIGMKDQLMCYEAALENTQLRSAFYKAEIETIMDAMTFTNREFARTQRYENRSIN